MRYISTRSSNKKDAYTFEDVLFTGYAKDGGLFMPEYIPKVTFEDLKNWQDSTYIEIAFELLKYYITEDEIPHPILKKLLQKSFSKFDIPDIVKVAYLNDGANIIELFHGPTQAFKDLALSCIGQFMQYFLSKSKKRVIILVGTSGDTGGAAIEAVKGLPFIDIIVLMPKGLCTPVQEAQMTTVLDDNVHVFQVEGTSDDLDEPIKKCFQDVNLTTNPAYLLCSINSINMVRVLVQIAHHVYAYIKISSINWNPYQDRRTQSGGNLTPNIYSSASSNLNIVADISSNSPTSKEFETGDCVPDIVGTQSPVLTTASPAASPNSFLGARGPHGETVVEVVIPSGAGGNAAAACMAIQMGVPLKITLTQNANDVIARTIDHGDFSAQKRMVHTMSCSMDIQVPYNLERIFYLYSKKDTELTSKLMNDFEKYRNVTIPRDLLNEIQRDIRSQSFDDESTKKAIVKCWENDMYILCPHTATGVAYFYDQKEKKSLKYPMVCVATASYIKFPQSIQTIKTSGVQHTMDDSGVYTHNEKEAEKRNSLLTYVPPKITKLLDMPRRFEEMKKGEDWFAILRDKIVDISKKAPPLPST